MKELLSLKEQYKKLTGTEYKPTNAPAKAQKENKKPVQSNEDEKLAQQIAQQGDKVRQLKTEKSTPKVN